MLQYSFSEYASRTRDMLRSIHASKPADIREKIVYGNSPFELSPPFGSNAGLNRKFKRGVLLTHGLSDSPYFMRHLGALFQEKGFRVMAVLLPGHGTQPGDLLNVSWKEWANEVAYGVEQLSHEVDEIYLAGFSAGGALSIYQSLVDARVKGLFLFSPALKISRKAMLAKFHKLYSWLIPSGRWLDIKPDLDIFKYESFPKNAAAQMYALTREVNELLERRMVDIPVFVAASADDATVDVSATLAFAGSAGNPRNKIVLYIANPNRIQSAVKSAAGSHYRVCIEFVNSVIPEMNIVSSSHAAIVLPPDDAHYGIDGDYTACAHYYPRDIKRYSACVKYPQKCLLGEVTKSNLKLGLLRRLMYNPKFDELKSAIKSFIDSLP
ncbi:MAG: alpha/beta fold hydrolase [Gallionella sp.]